MNNTPPLYRDQRVLDREHLNLLVIFHYIVAGLALMGIGFLVLHYMVMGSVFNNPEMWKNAKDQPPPQLFAMFKWFYLFMGFLLIIAAVGNLLSGLYLRARKHRTFSIVVAALNCLQIPFGTVLGVFTIVVLVWESVCQLYEPETANDS